MGRKPAGSTTIRDVARHAGVSPTAVSHVLGRGKNTSVRISPDTRERILQAAKELRYVHDARARHLRGAGSPMVGVLADSLEGVNRPTLLNHLTRALFHQGREILLGVHLGDTDVARRHVDIFRSYRTRGVLTIQGSVTLPSPIAKVLDEARDQCGPHVCVTVVEPPRDVPSVSVDYDTLLDRLFRLFEEGGCRSVMLVGRANKFCLSVKSAFDRAAAGHPGISTGALLESPPRWNPSGMPEDLVTALVERSRAGRVGVLAPDDEEAFLLMRQVRRRGVTIPDEVTVVGLFNLHIAAMAEPPLTTFDIMGLAAPMVESALSLMDALSAGRAMRKGGKAFVPELSVRESFVPVHDDARESDATTSPQGPK